MRSRSSDALWGLAIGAALGLALHLPSLALGAHGADDAASQRVAAELVRLGAARLRFVIALSLAVALASASIGAAVALLESWALGAARRWRTAALTLLVLAATVVRAFLAQPALLEPSLGGAHARWAPALAWLAARAAPWHVELLLGAALAAALGGGAWRRRAAWPAWRRAAGIAVALVAAIAAVGWWRAARPRRGALLILAADSLRPDRFTAETAPHLLALAAQGVSFDAALSPIARTTPAWCSILTGRYPHAHGVRHMFPRRALRADYLDWLPRRLADAGYSPRLSTDYAGDFFPLFHFGFARAHTPPPLTLGLVFEREVLMRSPLALALGNHRLGHAAFPVFRFLMTNADPERIADEVLDELDGERAVVVAFFSTTHLPFAPPWPWYRRFAAPDYGGAHRYAYDVQRLGDIAAIDAAQPAADVRQIRALYDGALGAVDAAAGRILAHLDARTPVILLADHGENLFEPGTTTHHGKWFAGGDEANRVPLVIAGPGVPRGVRVPEPVSLIDVAPTVAALLGLPAAAADGVSLIGAFAGHAPERDLFAETGEWLGGPATADGVEYPHLAELLEADPDDGYQLVLKTRWEDVVVEAKHRMLRRGAQKLLYIPTRSGVRWQLYDLATDPHQTRERSADDADTPALQRALKRFLARDPERELDVRDHLVRRSD